MRQQRIGGRHFGYPARHKLGQVGGAKPGGMNNFIFNNILRAQGLGERIE
jgi:hypothetical protein